eukprot:gene16539-22578_t
MAQSYRTNIQPQNGTGPYALGQTIIINIPTANNIVLAPTESYLKFACTITNGGTAGKAIWDACGAHGLIQRIRIFHGSNLLEDCDSYSLLAKMLFDLQVPTDASYGRFNELIGTRNDLIATTTAVAGVAAGAAVPAIPATNISCLQINSGESYDLAVNTSTTRYFCLNLISLLGTLCSAQYIPLFAMTTAPLRLEIQLVANTYQAITSTSALASISLSNVEYIGNFIKLSDGAMDVIYGSLGGQPLEFSIPNYANYQYTYSTITPSATAGSYITSTVNFAIPAKYSSLKSLFCTVRDQPAAATFFPLSCVSAFVSSYYFRVGSQIMPTKAPDNYPEMFAEVLKAMGSMSDLNYQPSIERTSYELTYSTAITTANFNTVNSGSFYIGIDLENYVSAPKDTMFAGYNSNTDDIFATITFYVPSSNNGGNAAVIVGAPITPRFDAFALFDATITFINGTAIRSF